MTTLVAIIIIAAVAAAVASPFVGGRTLSGQSEELANEQLEHEKNVALLAIRETEFDRAMGKLDPSDYAILRDDYEQRAMSAMAKLDHRQSSAGQPPPAPPASDGGQSLYCSGCGQALTPQSLYCSACGRAR